MNKSFWYALSLLVVVLSTSCNSCYETVDVPQSGNTNSDSLNTIYKKHFMVPAQPGDTLVKTFRSADSLFYSVQYLNQKDSQRFLHKAYYNENLRSSISFTSLMNETELELKSFTKKRYNRQYEADTWMVVEETADAVIRRDSWRSWDTDYRNRSYVIIDLKNDWQYPGKYVRYIVELSDMYNPPLTDTFSFKGTDYTNLIYLDKEILIRTYNPETELYDDRMELFYRITSAPGIGPVEHVLLDEYEDTLAVFRLHDIPDYSVWKQKLPPPY